MYTQYAFLDKEIVIIVDISNGLNIMSYFGHIVPHSFRIVPHSYLCEVSIETPSVFTHRKLASLKKNTDRCFYYVSWLFDDYKKYRGINPLFEQSLKNFTMCYYEKTICNYVSIVFDD